MKKNIAPGYAAALVLSASPALADQAAENQQNLQSVLTNSLVIGFMLFILLLAMIGWVVMIVRAARNRKLQQGKKTLWVLGQLFMPPLSIIYMIFVERVLFWRIFGWLLLFMVGLSAWLPTPDLTKNLPVIMMVPRPEAIQKRLLQDETRLRAQLGREQDTMAKLPYISILGTLHLLETTQTNRLSDVELSLLLDSLDARLTDGKIGRSDAEQWKVEVDKKLVVPAREPLNP